MLIVHHLGKSQSERIVWLCKELAIPYELNSAEYLAGDDFTSADIMTGFSLTTMRRRHSRASTDIWHRRLQFAEHQCDARVNAIGWPACALGARSVNKSPVLAAIRSQKAVAYKLNAEAGAPVCNRPDVPWAVHELFGCKRLSEELSW
jgi:hypothetical protein